MGLANNPVGGRHLTGTDRAAVLAAVVETCCQRPFGELSRREVAQRAGVSESTVVRNWPTRAHVVLDAFVDQTSRFEAPDTGSLRGDLVEMTRQHALLFENSTYRPLTIAALAACAEMGLDYRGINPPRQQSVIEIFTRAGERGDLPTLANPTLISQLLTGAVLHRLIILNEPVDDIVIGQLVDIVLPPSST